MERIEKTWKINWNIISQYRNELFGIATIFVLLVHANGFVWSKQLGKIMLKALEQGSMGVDIFLFLSGMGLYYSFKKDSSLKNFYRKRIKRVVVPYMALAIPSFIVIDFVLYRKAFIKFLADVLMISFWFDADYVVWFVPFIMMLYLLYPILYFGVLQKNKGEVKIIILFFAVLFFSIWLFNCVPDLYDKFERALSRLPVFVLGCLGGKWIFEKKEISTYLPVGAAFLYIIIRGVLVLRGGMISARLHLMICRGSFLAGTFAIVFLVPIILEKLHKRWIHAILIWFGGLSLEIYMIHIFLRFIYLSSPLGKLYNRSWIYFVFIIPISLVTAKIYEKIKNKIENFKEG